MLKKFFLLFVTFIIFSVCAIAKATDATTMMNVGTDSSQLIPKAESAEDFGVVKARFVIQMANYYASGGALWEAYVATCPSGTAFVAGVDPNITTQTGRDMYGVDYDIKECLCGDDTSKCPRYFEPYGNLGNTSYVVCEASFIESWFPAGTFSNTQGSIPDITGSNSFQYCKDNWSLQETTCTTPYSGTTHPVPGFTPKTYYRTIKYPRCW